MSCKNPNMRIQSYKIHWDLKHAFACRCLETTKICSLFNQLSLGLRKTINFCSEKYLV